LLCNILLAVDVFFDVSPKASQTLRVGIAAAGEFLFTLALKIHCVVPQNILWQIKHFVQVRLILFGAWKSFLAVIVRGLQRIDLLEDHGISRFSVVQ
jgi:hypothetical protein